MIGKPPVALECSACNTPLSRSQGIEGLCPSCLIELALDDTSLEAEVLVDSEEAPTLQYSGYTFEEGQIQGERYRVRSLLGRGGMGEVWRAYDLKLRQDVALKALRTELIQDQEALETLRQEVRTAREVISPNVCRVFDLQELDGQELVAMEYIDGTTLQEILKERSPLDLDEAREIASQFLAGLEAIHGAGLVHRDIKPENVMVTRTGRVVVMDFGIAKALGDGKGGWIAGTPAYMAPEQSRGEKLDARADVFSAGVVLAEMVEPGGVTSLEDRQRLWEAIHRDPHDVSETPWSKVVGRCVSGDPDTRYATAAELARALEEVTLRAVGDDTARPYPGLAAFQQEDTRFFFGRELEVEALWKKLRRPHLLAVIGPSGAGKSSFLRAGLLPTLADGWQTVLATPGNRPFGNLAQALAPQLGETLGAAELMQHFDEPDIAVELLSEWRQHSKHALLILDQFEELFTQNPEVVQESFAELLGRLPLEADLHVLLSMRDDFLLHCSELESLAPVFSELSPLKSLSGAALRRALVQPALKCGYRFEDESLVEEMLAEVEGERGSLPMVAFAAAKLWESRDRDKGLLTKDAYDAIGGVGGALAQHAEATLNAIGTEKIPIVHELFRNLVTAQSTRTARDREELLSVFDRTSPSDVGAGLAPAREREPSSPQAPKPSALGSSAAEVLNALIDARLLTSYEVQRDNENTPHHRIEIVHESLLSNWPRLVRWQMQDAEGAKLRDELRSQSKLWDEHERSVDYLWTGTAYLDYLAWRQRYPGGLTSTEYEYTRAMTAHAERRRRRKRLALTTALVLALFVAAVMAGLWLRSEAQARRAEAAQLLALAQLQLADDPTEALAYATASLELADTHEARLFALRALWEAPPAFELPSGVEANSQLAFSPNGNRLVTFGFSDEMEVFSAEGGLPMVLSGHGTTSGYSHGAKWLSDDLLATIVRNEGRARIWSLPDGDLVRELKETGPAYWMARDGDLMTEVEESEAETGHALYHLRRWHLPEGEVEELGTVDLTVLGPGFELWSFFDRSGHGWVYPKGNQVFYRSVPVGLGVADRRVAVQETEPWPARFSFPSELNDLWTQDFVTGELQQWDLSTPSLALLRTVPRPFGLEEGAFLSGPDPSGRWISSVTRQILLWNLDLWPDARPLSLRRSGPWAGSNAAVHPRGGLVAALTRGMTRLTFWPLRGDLPRVIEGYRGELAPLVFSPDGKWLATISSGQVLLLPLPGDSDFEARTLSDTEAAQIAMEMEFDPTGRFLLLVGWSDSVGIVPVDGRPPSTLEGLAGNSVTVAVAASPSGNLVASAPSRQGPWKLKIWNLETGERRLLDLPESTSSSKMGRAGAVMFLAFTDESTLYSSGDGGVRRWDLVSGSHELVLASQPESLTRMQLAADGRTAVVGDQLLEEAAKPETGLLKLLDLATGQVRELTAFGEGSSSFVLDSSGNLVATSDEDGIIQVGRVSAGAPHLLLGHQGAVFSLAISPDGHWLASKGEDDTLRLWPMPDLDKPPLHTLPHNELIAKLQSLTNLRAVRDPESSTGWSIELGPFPGWKEVPTW